MQRGFTKLFNTIVTSTIWQEDDKTRIVWITMLAIADHDGIVSAAVPGLASVAHVDIASTEKALKNLAAPDEYSRTQDFEGRRIEVIEGGWLILNYEKYRKMLSEEERREYKAKWIRQKRRQMSTASTQVDGSRPESTDASASLSASLSSEGVRGRFDEWMKFRRGLGKKPKDWDAMFGKQVEWLKQFNESDQFEILAQSIRNGWQGLFPPKRTVSPAASTPLLPTWGDRKAQKQMIDEIQEQKNELFKLKQREGREFTAQEQQAYNELAHRLKQLKSI